MRYATNDVLVDSNSQQKFKSPKKTINSLIDENEQTEESSAQIVTPGAAPAISHIKKKGFKKATRELFPANKRNIAAISEDEHEDKEDEDDDESIITTIQPKNRLIFGRLVPEMYIQQNVKAVYKIVRKHTGSIGGNGSHGPIYGELTMGSMQKMINLMKQCTGFDKTSKFIDVGSGIGKPNLHVAQDPGVQFSCGIEMELDRWRLGMFCLNSILKTVKNQQSPPKNKKQKLLKNGAVDHETIRTACTFIHGNIQAAKTFDPFTHVYMFSIGFPPGLWSSLAKMWNSSHSPYLICYHNPRHIIGKYEFDAELITQISTSMHGSSEVHTGYLYKRGLPSSAKKLNNRKCDKLFLESSKMVQDFDALQKYVESQVDSGNISRRVTRAEARKQGILHSK